MPDKATMNEENTRLSASPPYFSVNSENFVELYVNVNGILLPIRKGGDGFDDNSGGSKAV